MIFLRRYKKYITDRYWDIVDTYPIPINSYTTICMTLMNNMLIYEFRATQLDVNYRQNLYTIEECDYIDMYKYNIHRLYNGIYAKDNFRLRYCDNYRNNKGVAGVDIHDMHKSTTIINITRRFSKRLINNHIYRMFEKNIKRRPQTFIYLNEIWQKTLHALPD